MEMKTMNQKSK